MYLPSQLFLGILLNLGLGRAIILRERDLPHVATSNYDFIIIGGGTAGNVIANRLTENSNFNVLVIEAGPSDEVLELQVPFLCTHTTPQTPWDWNYTTVAQPGLNGVSIAYPRGHVLGGSSSINCLVYTRGSESDFDRYANFTGDEGWSWSNILPYFKKSEIFTPPADHHNTTGQFDPSVHGFDGIHAVSLPGAPTAIDGPFRNALSQLGGEFSPNVDYNSGTPLGFSWAQASVGGAKRSSSSTSYLSREYLLRPNLHVLLNAQVSRILSTGQENSFRGIEYRLNGGGPMFQVTASKEVVISAGAVNTPQILFNSGIGDFKTLQSLGIKSLIDLPGVGQNMSDHPIITLAWNVNVNDTFDDFNRNTSLQTQELEIWKETGQGTFVDGIASHIGFIRVADNSSIFSKAPNPSAGEKSPHFEIFASNFLLGNTPSEGNFLSISAIMLTPSARGTVKVNSSNPFGVPLIDPALLAGKTDLPLMRESVKSILKLASAPAWSDFIISPVAGQPNANASDTILDAFIVDHARSAYHTVGTASMSARNESGGVVDPDLKLKKVTGVRVVDSSVLPFIPAGHTQASTYALAERAADLIKAEHA